MKAITVCQPYAHLICLPDTSAICKRIENRKRAWHYRGPIAIHAGKSRKYLHTADTGFGPVDCEYGISVSKMAFGAVVATAILTACYPIGTLQRGPLPDDHVWLRGNRHAEGPFCLILADVKPLAEPIPYSGCLGLWEFPDELLKVPA